MLLQAFPKGSALAVDVSTSIIELIEKRKMPQLDTMLSSTFNCSSSTQLDGSSSLGPWPFAGLFFISGSIAILALLYTLLNRLRNWLLTRAQVNPHDEDDDENENENETQGRPHSQADGQPNIIAIQLANIAN